MENAIFKSLSPINVWIKKEIPARIVRIIRGVFINSDFQIN